MSLVQKLRTPIYDTPATYNQFSGGINTNLSNEALELNELRDGLNCDYVNQSLVNRKGERIINKLLLPITSRPQGDFMFSAEHKDYIISVRNGHIFYGTYSNTIFNIPMSLLLIDIPKISSRDSEENYLIDLEERTSVDLTKDTNGYIYKYYAGNNNDPDYKPSEDEYKKTLIIQNTKRVQGIPITVDKTVSFILATGTRILQISEYKDPVTSEYYLYAKVLGAYKPNSWELKNIGVNNLSPFPNYLIDTEVNVPKTSIGQITTEPKQLGLNNLDSIKVKALVNCLFGTVENDLYFKWEVRIGVKSDWKKILWWNPEKNPAKETSKGKSSITITKAKLEEIKGSSIAREDEIFFRCTLTSDFLKAFDIKTKTTSNVIDTDGDFIADQAIAQYSKTHISRKVLESYTPENALADNEFKKIHSCTKVVSDGNKLLFYDDAAESCEWYKSVIDKPNYITYGGNLNFRTNKNEKLTGVLIFDKNIIVFADNEKLGGNISVVTGNGDDYNDGQYYSPYKRTIVNTNVSCDAYNTIQVAENYIIFKYRNDIYMLDTNDLDGERVQVVTINDKVKQRLNNIEFPLDRIREPYSNEHITYDFHEFNKCLKPDEIFSEVCDGFYGLIFPHQGFHLDTFEYPDDSFKYYEGSNQDYIDFLKGRQIENVKSKPGLRWKCYFRKGAQYKNSAKIFYPWLRDVSQYLNICGILTINGESTMVTNSGELVQFNNESYSGLTESSYKVKIVSRCYDMELPTLCKFMDNLNVYYNRDFTKELHLTCTVKNEADFDIYTPNIEAFINMDKPGGEVRYEEQIKLDDAMNLPKGYGDVEDYTNKHYVDPIEKPVQVLDLVPLDTAVLNRPSFSSQTYTPKYRFPFLSAQVIIELKSNQAFSLSALTFSYTSNDMPDFTREKLYRDILKGNILQ